MPEEEVLKEKIKVLDENNSDNKQIESRNMQKVDKKPTEEKNVKKVTRCSTA